MAQPVPTASPRPAGENRVFHPWFVSQFALGVCLLAGGFFMVPAYLGSRGVSSADVGLVMSLIGVGALVSPFLGRAADRFGAHRAAQIGGVAATAVACLGFSVADEMVTYGASALVLGLGQAAVMSMNASLVMGSGGREAVQARSMTALAAMLQLGQTVGLLAISLGTSAGLSYPSLFLVLACVSVISLVVTALTNRESARRLAEVAAETSRRADVGARDGSRTPGRVGIMSVAFSALGAFLLAATLSQTGQMAIETQLPIYMDGVFGIPASTVSAALSLAAGLCLVSFVPIGRWSARSGPMPAWLLSQSLRVVGMTLLLVVGLRATSGAADPPSAIPLAIYLLAYLSYPLFNAAAPVVVGRVSTAVNVGTGEAQGLYVGALAVCGIVGPIIGGWLASAAGLEALPWAPLLGAAAALVVTIVGVRPAMRR